MRYAYQAFAVLTYALRLPYELRSPMRFAYLMGCAHLCALLIVIHDEYDSRPYEPVTSFQQPKEVTKTKWSGTILNIQRMTRRAKYRMYFVKAALQQVTYPCASRLTLVVKTRSRRGFHLDCSRQSDQRSLRCSG